MVCGFTVVKRPVSTGGAGGREEEGYVVQRRRRLLDVETILDAALACIDERGRLTMADLAARLGGSASSIYHHVSGRPEIVELLRERLVDHLEIPPLDRSDWGDQV